MAVINVADEVNCCLGICFNCSKVGHQWRDCSEELKESLKAVKQEWGRWGEGKPHPPICWSCLGLSSQAKKMTKPWLSPSAFWNKDPCFRWLDRQDIINGKLTTSLIDKGAWMNIVTPEFMKAKGQDVGSIQDLNNHDGFIPINGCWGGGL